MSDKSVSTKDLYKAILELHGKMDEYAKIARDDTSKAREDTADLKVIFASHESKDESRFGRLNGIGVAIIVLISFVSAVSAALKVIS